MRQIGVLPDAFQARTLADYLLTLRIETRVEQQPDGCALWVCDEDRVDQARQELTAFLKNPRAPQYAAAAPTAAAIRQKEDEIDEDYGRRQTELREAMTDKQKPALAQHVTTALIIAAVLVFAFSRFGEDSRQPLMQALFIAPFRTFDGPNQRTMIEWDGLDAITKRHEVWRLVTPILLHFDIIHLLFNVLMLYQLGGDFERRRGTLRYVLFVLAVAIGSNIAQYYLGWVAHVSKWRAGHEMNPQFGGLSGVNYALFGYNWMKSRLQPALGFVVTPNLVVIMVGWFLLCFTGAVGPVANIAHAAGLGMGMLIGAAPTVWRNLLRSEPRP
jgi:GlpG protein